MVVVKEMRMSNLGPAACPERSLNRPGPDHQSPGTLRPVGCNSGLSVVSSSIPR